MLRSDELFFFLAMAWTGEFVCQGRRMANPCRYISMSRLKPFSFSDDSADLTLPITLTPPDVLSNKQLTRSVAVFGTGDDYAKVFVQIHQDQSLWYQAMYFTDQGALQQPYTMRLDSINKNAAWLSRIPQSAKGPLRSRFLVQIFYGSLLLMLPSPSSLENISTYGQALALENICSYADAVEGIAGKSEPLGTTKNDDFLRTMIISRRLLQLVREDTSPVYVVPCASSEELMISARLPGLTWTLQGQAIPLVIEALRKLGSALAWLTAKYDHTEDYRSWKADSEHALQLLYSHYSLSNRRV